MRRLLPLAFLLLVAAGDEGPFRVAELPPAGRISAVAYDDLDGDGRAEVLVFRGKRLHLHVPDAFGNYDPTTPQVLDLDPDALFFGTGQVDADPRTREVVLLRPGGVVCHSIENGRLSPQAKPVIEAENLLAGRPEEAVHAAGFLRDLDGDGLPDVALATADGFSIWYQGGHGPADGAGKPEPGVWPPEPSLQLPAPPDPSLSPGSPGLTGRIRGRVEVPDLLVLDFTGDGRPDLVVDDGRRLRIFPAGEDGRVTAGPPEQIDLSPLAAADAAPPPFTLADVNGDGHPDFLVSRREAGVLEVHLGGRPLGKAQVRIEGNGALLPVRVLDLNGDGRPDLVVPHTPGFNLPTALAAKFSGSITLEVRVFLNTGDPLKPFRSTPDSKGQVRTSVRLELDDTGRIPEDRTVLCATGGDFTGDGRPDLVAREDTDSLLLVPGRPDGHFDFGAAETLAVPDAAGFSRLVPTVGDLDGDGTADLAILYGSRSGREDRLVLLLTRRE